MKHIFLFIVLLCSFQLTAQEPAHYVVGKEIFDGVHLYSIIQDDTDNSIWLTSNKGIYHYDGIKFTHKPLPESKNASLFDLKKDVNGNIYCHNLNGQIFKLKNKQFQLYYEVPKIYSKNINVIQFDNRNNLLVHCNNNQLLFVNEKKEISNLYKGTVLIGKNKDTIFYIKCLDKTKQLVKYINSKEVITTVNDRLAFPIKFINNKAYGFHLQTQFFKFNHKKLIEISLPFAKNAPFHLSQTAHHLWFGSYKKGVYCIANKNIETNLSAKKWFKDYFISGAFTDNENNTWLLTFKKGIIIIPNIKNTITIAPNGYDFQGISKTDNQLYISTQNGQIFQLKNEQFIPYFKADDDDRVEFIKVYPKQHIIATNMKRYFANYKHKSGFCRDATLVKDSLLIALNAGLFKKSIKKEHTKNGQRLTKGRIYSIYHDTLTQKTWFSTTNGLKQHKNGTVTNLNYNGKEIIEAVIQPVHHQVWTVSKDGVFIFENDSIIKHLTQKDRLLSNNVANIKFEHPNVYLAYQKGLQRYNIETKTFSNFTFSDGLTKSTTKFEVLNDTVYGINSDGLLRFTFNNKNITQKNYTTQITEATANGNHPIQNNSELPADIKNLSFSFLTSTFKYQKDLRYEYQLIGVDTKPVLAKENQLSVNYANIPAGNYIFKVDSYLGTQKNKSAILNFSIAKYWYKTVWFQLSIIVLTLLILYYIYRTRVNTILQKRDKETLQKRLAESSLTSLKAQMNPHFLFNAMNSIQSLILDDQKDQAYEYLTQLSNLVRENLKMSDVSFVPFSSELQLINKYLELEKLRFEETFTYNIENTIKKEELLIPSMIIQPFIENAIKHGLLHRKSNRKLTVNFSLNDSIILCTITDNGIGRKASEEIKRKRKYQSFSTNAIKKRFTILKEYYKIDIGFSYEDLYDNNGTATGTRVTIKIPFTNEFTE